MEFVILRYAPMHGHMNVGVVLFERAGDHVSFAKARFIEDMQRVSTFDPDADLNVLRSTFRDIEREINDPTGTVGILQLMQDSFSNLLQVTDSKGVLISGDPMAEFDTLASMHLSSVSSN
jgi:Protein of unknown function (DUF3037)